jgi:cbb3-type cytochrome oxidase subunit 1
MRMDSDTRTTNTVTAKTSSADDTSMAMPDRPDSRVVDKSARPFALLAVVFFAVSAVLGAIAAMSLSEPAVTANVEFLSYGRLYPAAMNLFVNGWLTLGFIAAAMFLVPKVLNRRLASRGLGMIGAALYSGGVVAGAVAVLLGYGDGKVGFEAPWYVDVTMFVGVLLVSRSVGVTVRRREDRSSIPPSVLFLTAGVMWLALALLVALPFGGGPTQGLGGVLQNVFARGAVVGLWLTAAGFGVTYYVVHRITGAPTRPTDRSVLATFWSVAVAMPFYGATQITYSVLPDWLETLGAMFAIGAILPALILANHVAGLIRSRIDNVSDVVTLKWLSFGTASFVAFIALTALGTIRSVASVTQLTPWTSGVEFLALGGAFTAWLVAFYRHAGPDFVGKAIPDGISTGHLRLTTLGVVGFTISSMVAGVVSGYAWIGAANSPDVSATGADFALSSLPTLGALGVRGASMGLFALGALFFAVSVLASRAKEGPVPAVDDLDEGLDVLSGSSVGFAKLTGSAVGLFVIAAAVVWLIPSTEVNPGEGTILGDTTRVESSEAFAAGKEIYFQQGCAACHTQQVRPIVTDVGLGVVSAYGDYVNEDTVPLGLMRLGPDLMHVGSRDQTGSVVFLRGYLADPRSERAWSTMPSYGYLSEAELEALATYLAGLK